MLWAAVWDSLCMCWIVFNLRRVGCGCSVMKAMGEAVVQAIDRQDWPAAAAGFEAYVDGPPDLFQNITGTLSLCLFVSPPPLPLVTQLTLP
jgi:hypothetical protein